MTLVIEGFKNRFLKDGDFKPHKVEPEVARRKMFLANAGDYLNATEFTGYRFNRFCEAMIYAMDGTQVSPSNSVAEWIDIHTDQTFQIMRSREYPWDLAGIMAWFDLHGSMVLDETLTFGKKIDIVDAKTGKPVPTIRRDEGLDVYTATPEDALRICREFYGIYTRGLVRPTFEIYLNQHGHRTRFALEMVATASLQ